MLHVPGDEALQHRESSSRPDAFRRLRQKFNYLHKMLFHMLISRRTVYATVCTLALQLANEGEHREVAGRHVSEMGGRLMNASVCASVSTQLWRLNSFASATERDTRKHVDTYMYVVIYAIICIYISFACHVLPLDVPLAFK